MAVLCGQSAKEALDGERTRNVLLTIRPSQKRNEPVSIRPAPFSSELGPIVLERGIAIAEIGRRGGRDARLGLGGN